MYIKSVLSSVALIFSLSTVAQPFMSEMEAFVGFSDIQNCFETSCSDVKVSVAVAQTKFNNINLTGVFKLSDDKGKLGGQVLVHINPYVWIAGETVTNFGLETDFEILVGAHIPVGDSHFYPYSGFYYDSRSLAAVGIKWYYDEYVSVGFEYHTPVSEQDTHHFALYLGASITKSIFEPLQSVLSPGKLVDDIDDRLNVEEK